MTDARLAAAVEAAAPRKMDLEGRLPCVECSGDRPPSTGGRGLCRQCYNTAIKDGTIENYSKVAEPWNKGMVPDENARRRDNGQGYVNVWVEGRGWRAEHRHVMEVKLGRPLLRSESVHHINGMRHDNRPENLELWWLSGQPAGQRVADLIAYLTEHHADQLEARGWTRLPQDGAAGSGGTHGPCECVQDLRDEAERARDSRWQGARWSTSSALTMAADLLEERTPGPQVGDEGSGGQS